MRKGRFAQETDQTTIGAAVAGLSAAVGWLGKRFWDNSRRGDTSNGGGNGGGGNREQYYRSQEHQIIVTRLDKMDENICGSVDKLTEAIHQLQLEIARGRPRE